jgi:hypothetical protein
MGFNKRYVTEDGILYSYASKGIEGVKKYFSADALIIESGFADQIHDLLIKAMGDDDWSEVEAAIEKNTKNVKDF